MNNKHKLIALLVFVLTSLSLFTLFYTYYVIEDVKIYPADVYFSEDKVGFNLDKDALHFGIVKINEGSSERKMVINNILGYPVKVMVEVNGNLGPMVHISEESNNDIFTSSYILPPYENKTIIFTLIPLTDVNINEQYTGKIKITTKKLLFY